MKNRPTNDVLFVDDSYPMSISNKWTRGKSKSSSDNVVDDCSSLTDKETCNKADNCTFDEIKKNCEEQSNFDAIFTHGPSQKTYFFRGSMVYLYLSLIHI